MSIVQFQPGSITERLRIEGLRQFPIIVPVLLLAMATGVLFLLDTERWVAAQFYDAATRSWPYCDKAPWEPIDHAAIWVGWSMLAIAIFICNPLSKYWREPWARRLLLLVFWVIVIGPGLLISVVMKPSFGRPRPREAQQFGGTMVYSNVLSIGESKEINASFPSGHASFGFIAIVPAFAFHRRKKLARTILSCGLVWGSIVGLSRVVQGGHFWGDVVWAAAIVYFSAWMIDAAFRAYPIWVGGESVEPESIPFSQPSMQVEIPHRTAA